MSDSLPDLPENFTREQALTFLLGPAPRDEAIVDYIPGGAVLDDFRRAVTYLYNAKVALDEWTEKTEWVQETAQVHELGRHRADVLRSRIEDK